MMLYINEEEKMSDPMTPTFFYIYTMCRNNYTLDDVVDGDDEIALFEQHLANDLKWPCVKPMSNRDPPYACMKRSNIPIHRNVP